MKTKTLTFCALMTALSVLLLALGNIMPTGQLALAALSSLPVMVTVMRFGKKTGLWVYAAAALLTFLILPRFQMPVLFAVALGHYPVFKSLFESFPKRVTEWGCKFLLCNAVFTAVILLFSTLLMPGVTLTPGWTAVGLAAGNVVFFAYDVGLSHLVQLIGQRLTFDK